MAARKACWVLPLVFCPLAGGCGGQYILTVPDQLARAGGETPTVVRLQRNDFFVLAPPLKEAAMSFRVADGPERAAYTDKLGYAAAAVPVPKQPGRYTMRVVHLDSRYGDEPAAEGAVYVWDPNRPVVAVDMDCLPGLPLGSSRHAARALRRLAAAANVLYLTRRSAKHHAAAHEALTKAGYPAGPILAWRRQRWHIVREGRFRLPRIIVESRLVSQLPEVRRMFPGLSTGLCDSALAARAYAAAGMKVVMIGTAPADVGGAIRRRNSWADLADRGL